MKVRINHALERRTLEEDLPKLIEALEFYLAAPPAPGS